MGNNAVKFTPQGGEIVIGVDAEIAGENRAELHFWIRDTGIGMSLQQQRKLFQSFSQADSSTTRKYGGTGLGLAICKRLIDLLDGEVWVDSRPEQGSTFHFRLAFDLQNLPAQDEHLYNEKLKLNKVLIVDDNDTSRQLLEQMLYGFGFRHIAMAENGEQALAMLQGAEPNGVYQLVLMDWKMPKKDGLETSRLILQSGLLSQIPQIIMLTAFGREDIESAAEKLGLAACLAKPVQPAYLFRTICQTLSLETKAPKATTEPQEITDKALNYLAGARILLVEDDTINQQLVEELLQAKGLSIVTANHGKEALQCLEQQTFDAVLMDCQMPVMDGYQTSIEIRRQAKFVQLPIIAMTANVMSKDKDRALSAGMNDHIGKPININEMFKVLMKWIPARSQANLDRENIDGKGLVLLPSTLPGVDLVAGRAIVQGNEKLYLKLLMKFYENYQDFDQEFIASRTSGDPQFSARLAHTLCGVAGTIGAKEIQELARILELGCIDMLSDSQITHLLTNLMAKLKPLQLALAELGNIKQPDEEPVVLDIEQIKAVVIRLHDLLQDHDTAAVEVLSELKGFLKNSQPQALRKLVLTLDDYDFELAIVALQQLSDAIENS
jgi:CheY-like chemotaxis protein